MIEEEFSSAVTTTNSHQHVENIQNDVESSTNPVEVNILQPLLQTQPAELSIEDRFFRSHEIRLMPELPTTDTRLQYTTIITSEGLFQLQLNQALNTLEWRCRLNLEQLDQLDLSNFVAYSTRCPLEEGTLIYEALTFKSLTLAQLRMLEIAVIDADGRSVIGYTINESLWIRFVGRLFREQYPPKPNDYSRQWLEMLYQPIMQDISLSFRVTLFTYILVGQSLDIYFQENKENNIKTDNLYHQNIKWFFLALGAFAMTNLLLLRGNCLEKLAVSSLLNCTRRIEQHMIVVFNLLLSETLSSILLKIMGKASNTVIRYSTIPLLILAIKLGFDNNDALYMTSSINIFHRPQLRTLFISLCYAFTTSSFASLEARAFISTSLMVEKNQNDDYPVREQAFNIQSIIQSSVFSITLLTYLARYPYAPKLVQNIGRYASNVSNAIGNAFLISYIIVIIELSVRNFLSFELHQSKIWLTPAFLSLQPLNLLYAFMTAFPATSNLPELSIEPILPEKTWCEEISERIEPVKHCFRRFREDVDSIEIFGVFRTNRVIHTNIKQIIDNSIHHDVNDIEEKLLNRTSEVAEHNF